MERAKAAEKAARAAEALRVKEAQAAAEAEEKARVIACVIAPDGLPHQAEEKARVAREQQASATDGH